MRILLVVPWDKEIGGVAAVVRNLANYWVSRGHDVLLFNPGKAVFAQTKETKLGVPGYDLRLQMPFGERHPVISLPAFVILFVIATLEILRIIRKHKIDVINVHYPTDCFFYFAICKKITRRPLVTSVHGADVVLNGRPQAQYSWAFKLLLSSSDAIVAPSRAFADNFAAVLPALRAKTTVIHNSVNLSELDGFGAESLLGEHSRYVLCVSAYKEQKAIDVLLRAFQIVHRSQPLLRLVIVGEGDLRPQLETLVVALDLADSIELRGASSRAEVARLMHECEFFVLPSRFETFGIVILEAMACHKAVVASRVGGIPEIVEHLKTGILVNPDDPESLAQGIITLITNQELRDSLGARAYNTVHQRFGHENSGRAYESVFVTARETQRH